GQLVRAGLVAREIDPADRRRLAVRLTEAGRLRIEAAVAERVADNERLGRLLPEGDTRTLDRLMRAYLGALEQETP
ncbi:MAG TPA: MarR family transcriptional regulator, partial [Candidatus Krumholzibacteria bacterium]|nr:MarR family transcriptional regulator [Candidatus Krumholzibacteria bacterium]